MSPEIVQDDFDPEGVQLGNKGLLVRTKTLRAEDLHESDYSPWAGWEIVGWPTTTILRSGPIEGKSESERRF